MAPISNLPMHLRDGAQTIHTVEMHTAGEPTRIITHGYPAFPPGLTLLEAQDHAQRHYDHIRRRLMLEPRGHHDMHGAVLVHDTELTRAGQADVGVLFLQCAGYSSMCGHASMALARYIVDCHDDSFFPRRNELKTTVHHDGKVTVRIRLHAPCGVLDITVPATDGGRQADPQGLVSMNTTPGFALGQHTITFDNRPITFDLAWGGALFIVLPVTTMGIEGLTSLELAKVKPHIPTLLQQAAKLKALVASRLPSFMGPTAEDKYTRGGVFAVLFTDTVTPVDRSSYDFTAGGEVGMCIFADGQIDRSPCGGGVQARVALAYFRGEQNTGRGWWVYHSPLTLAQSREKGNGTAPFMGRPVLEVVGPAAGGGRALYTELKGRAKYTGSCTWVVEEGDELGENGFVVY